MRRFSHTLSSILAGLLLANTAQAQVIEDSQDYKLEATTITNGLEHPWGLDFLPDGSYLVTERSGELKHIRNGKITTPPQPDLDIAVVNQGGLLDVAISPEFAKDRQIFLTFSHEENGRYGTALAAVTLGYENGAITEIQKTEILFSQKHKTHGGRHFGSRIAFDHAGQHIFFSIGDRGDRNRAQDGQDTAGKIIRLERDGDIPADNPFVGNDDYLDEIWSLGHRNPQGMALDQETGHIWVTEHGARGGDELNRAIAGRNYGWPVISYGRHYSGGKIGEGTEKDGMEQPIYYWDPSIAPSGLAYYTGDMFPNWKGQFFAGALKHQKLLRLQMDANANTVTSEEILFERDFGRVRAIEQGPDGALYMLTDRNNGRLVRIALAE